MINQVWKQPVEDAPAPRRNSSFPFCLSEPQHVPRPRCWSTVRTSVWGSRSWHQNQLYLHESRGWCTTSWRRHLYSLDQVRGQECAWVLPCKHLMFVFIVTFTLWLNASPPNPVRAHNSERGCSAPAPQDGLGHSILWRTPPLLPQTRPSGIPSIWSSAMEYKSHSGKV